MNILYVVGECLSELPVTSGQATEGSAETEGESGEQRYSYSRPQHGDVPSQGGIGKDVRASCAYHVTTCPDHVTCCTLGTSPRVTCSWR